MDVIKNVVLKYDETREYLASSPTNGIESEEEGYIAKDPQSRLFGDSMWFIYWGCK